MHFLCKLIQMFHKPMIIEHRLVKDIDRPQGNVHSYVRLQNVTHTFNFWKYRILPEAGKAYRLSWVSQCFQTNSVAVLSDMCFLPHTFHVIIQVIIRCYITTAVELTSFNAPGTMKRENTWSKDTHISTNVYHTHLCS